MTNNGKLTIPKIEGFSDAHILYTIEEITKGTDFDSIQKLLYSKFGLYCFHAEELIEKVVDSTGLKTPTVIDSNCQLTQKLIKDGYKHDEIEGKIKELYTTENKKKAGNDLLTLIFSAITLGVCFMIFSGLNIIIGSILIKSTIFFKDFLLTED
jgi:hypothetical protein